MGYYSTKAKQYFLQGYNCAQSVTAAFADKMNIDEKLALKTSSPFGAGMGRLREVCGALTGVFIVVGYLYGYDNPNDDITKAKHYNLIQEFAIRFKEINKSIICRDLLGVEGFDSPVPQTRDKNYYLNRPCLNFVEMAAQMLEDYISKKESGNENSSSV